MKDYTDKELINLYLEKQDNRYFAELYERYANKVYRKCLTMLKNESDAKDESQNVLLKALLNVSKFRGDSSFSTYIFRITYNNCIDFLKQRQKKSNFQLTDYNLKDEDLVIDEFELEDNRLFTEKKEKELIEAIEKLNADERVILLMKYNDGYKIKEISDFLNISESAVKMRLKRIREKLKNKLNTIILFFMVKFNKLYNKIEC